MIISLKKREGFKIFGPAAFTVKRGKVEVLGRKYGAGEKTIVHRLKSYVVYAVEDSELELVLGEQAIIQPVEPGDPYNEWAVKAEEILEEDPEKIIVLGGVDEGKSSYTVLLLNKAFDKGLKPAVIDADMGQADIGPPGFITLSYPDKQVIWLRELKPAAMRFIGDIKPQNYKSRVIFKIRELVEKALSDGYKPVIIDTDGWIYDSFAVMYKCQMIEEIKPDIIAVLGESLHGLFTRYTLLGSRIYELRSLQIRKTRSREERRSLRSDKYKEYLAEARTMRIPMDKVIISGTPIFAGTPLDTAPLKELLKAEVVYASKTPDTIYLILDSPTRLENIEYMKKIYGVEKYRYYIRGFEKGTYVALTDQYGNDYPAIIEDIDYAKKEFIVKTVYPDIDVRIIKFSKIKITPEYIEQIIE